MSLTSIKDGSTLLARLATLATSLILLQSHSDQNLSSHVVRLQLPWCYSIQDTEDTDGRVDTARTEMKGDVIHLHTGKRHGNVSAPSERTCRDRNPVSMAESGGFKVQSRCR